MCSTEQRKPAIETYVKFDLSAADTVAKLGYPTKQSLGAWYKDYLEHGEVRPPKRQREPKLALEMCLVTDNRYGVCPSLLRDQRTILTIVGTARWLVFSLTPQGCLLLESPRAVPVTRGPAMT